MGRQPQTPLIVVKGSGIPLFGIKWLEQMKLDWAEVVKIKPAPKGVADSFNKIWGRVQGGAGTVQRYPAPSPC